MFEGNGHAFFSVKVGLAENAKNRQDDKHVILTILGARVYNLPGTLRLRAVDETDSEFLEELYFSRRADLQQITGDAQFVRQIIKMQQQMQTVGIRNNFPMAKYLLLEDGSMRIGRLVVDVGTSDVRLVDIALLPEVQGRGTGKQVLQAMQEDALSRGLSMSLAVEKNNLRARTLYLSAGFHVHSEDSMFEQLHWHPESKRLADGVQHAA